VVGLIFEPHAEGGADDACGQIAGCRRLRELLPSRWFRQSMGVCGGIVRGLGLPRKTEIGAVRAPDADVRGGPDQYPESDTHRLGDSSYQRMKLPCNGVSPIAFRPKSGRV
jgi:hypothetical protein